MLMWIGRARGNLGLIDTDPSNFSETLCGPAGLSSQHMPMLGKYVAPVGASGTDWNP